MSHEVKQDQTAIGFADRMRPKAIGTSENVRSDGGKKEVLIKEGNKAKNKSEPGLTQ